MTARASDRARRDAEPVVPLVVHRAFDGGAAEVAGALAGPASWLGDQVGGADLPEGWHRFLVDMRLPVGDGRRLSFRKAAFVEIGPVTRRSGEASAEIGWYAAGLQPLFPVFAGRVRAAGGELRLEGCYAPPGGAVGVIADRLLLHVAASGTARWLLGELAAASQRRQP